MHTPRYVVPAVAELHVLDSRGRAIKTLDALRAHLHPIETLEEALAYRYLLRTMEMERGQALYAHAASSAIQFTEDDSASWGYYVAEQAERWGIGTERTIEEQEHGFVITGPRFRWLTAKATTGVVELVRETIYRDGRYRREVLRELERGEAAMVHRPWPLM